jgi:hypothetical protein
VPINFEVLNQAFQAIVPVVEGRFVYRKKSYVIKADDGWAWVEISGNHVDYLGPETPSGCDCVLGYTFHNSVVFQNADVAKRRWGMSGPIPLYLNSSPTFESIRAVIWEDGRAYWLEPDYTDTKCLEIRDLESLDGVKGITPELRTVFLFHALEKEKIKLLEEKKAHEEVMRSVPGRLKITFERAGARLLTYSLTGKRIVVDWEMGGDQFNSVIDADTWMVCEAGICMSGADSRMNITSLVQTTEDYQDRGLIYKTRET